MHTLALDALIPAPFGFVGVRCFDNGEAVQLMVHALPMKSNPHPHAQTLATEIAAYLQDPTHVLPVVMPCRGTAFQQRVWRAIRQIPVGVTWTYSQLARAVGSGPRAVANACGANPLPLLTPCHRVIASNGLGGFMQGEVGGLQIKRWLLAHEQGQSV